MIKKTKLYLTTFGLLLFAVLLHFLPLPNISFNIPILKNISQHAGITITTKNGIAKTSINNTDYGETPISLTNIKPGKYHIKMERVTENNDIYEKEEFHINLQRGTEAILDIEIAPNGFKSGYILVYSPAPTTYKDEGYLTIQSEIEDINVRVNDQKSLNNQNKIYKLEEGEYYLSVEKKGFEKFEIPIIIRHGYNLNVTVYLLPIPINIS